MAKTTPVFSETTLPIKSNDHRKWGGLTGCAIALAISEAASKHQGLSVVITPDTQTAQRLEHEISFFSGDERPTLHFPDWEMLPYDSFSPHQDIISQRLKALHQLPQLNDGILIVPVSTMMAKISPPEYVNQSSFVIEKKNAFDLTFWKNKLTTAGYHSVDTVYEHGEYAIRGSILDLFPMGSSEPVRIELLDDEVESLRLFNPDTQRSKQEIDYFELLPAKEFPLTPEAISRFKSAWRERFDVNHRQCPMYQDVSEGIATAGLEYYLPLFHERSASLLEYLPESTVLFTLGDLAPSAKTLWDEIKARYENLKFDVTRPLLPPAEIAQAPEQLFSSLKPFPRVNILKQPVETTQGNNNFGSNDGVDLFINAHLEQPFKPLMTFIENKSNLGASILFTTESAGRREGLLERLKSISIRPKVFSSWNEYRSDSSCSIALVVAPLELGAELNNPQLSIITESQLYGHQVQQKRRRKKEEETADLVVKNLTELKLGAPVVHIDHGVGRYCGLQSLEVDKQAIEFLTLKYANEATLYVPVSSLHLISRYSGSNSDTAPLHRLGTETWQKEKRKAAEKAHDVAAELLDIYARRAAKEGFVYKNHDMEYTQFSSEFPFEETPDQQSAIESTIADMTSHRPMDRLICGDVGFGKTEVAMRAVFIATQNSKQVVILVPTTLLAQQHHESFKDRFADWPVKVEVLSRFKSAKEQSATLKLLESGHVDVIIGTHKLLQDNINFKDLGLIIIDEEHRFGVRHKEKLKSLRSDVDILTLTATPIPRTLNMAMSGMRDISIIATPPSKRLSIKTFVRQHNQGTVKEAILRELLRGGQVYYLHNEVKSIEKSARELEALLPEARIGIAHGQMRERELEQVMSEFYHKRFNVLICTTIIETGIDVPSANTIIMDRADKLGLAQLHQLRGRVGRSHHQAYAYLLTPPPKTITKDAVKRLNAIAEADTLGAGFALASHDLEIRGAGELLGDEQSGDIHSIGYSLYLEMLEQAVQAIKEGKTPNLDKPLKHGTEVNLRLPALIPDDYLPDVHSRLTFYKRISSGQTEQELDEIQVEMIDRFGLLPNPIKNLFHITLLKLQAESLGITKIDAGAQGGTLEFQSETRVDPLKLVQLVQSQPTIYKLVGGDKLKFFDDLEEIETRFKAIENLLVLLSPAPEQQNAKKTAASDNEKVSSGKAPKLSKKAAARLKKNKS